MFKNRVNPIPNIKPFAEKKSYPRKRIYFESDNPDFSVLKKAENVVAMGSALSYGPCQVPGSEEGLSLVFLDSNFMEIDEINKTIILSASCEIQAVSKYLDQFNLYLPVVPGAARATIGGCIAADVHGKNTHQYGTFGNHILRIWIWDGLGEVKEISKDINPELFADTIGGFGMTGIMTRAEIALKSIPGQSLHTKTKYYDSANELLLTLCNPKEQSDYSGAILDLNQRNFPGILLTSDWSRDKPCAVLSLPRFFTLVIFRMIGISKIRRSFIQLGLRYQLVKVKYLNREKFLNPEKVWFVVSSMAGWNYVYGKRLIERQILVPKSQFQDVIARIHKEAKKFKVIIGFCGVKHFTGSREGTLSFAQPGISITIQYEAKYKDFNEAITYLIVSNNFSENISKMQSDSKSFPSGYPNYLDFAEKYGKNIFQNQLLS